MCSSRKYPYPPHGWLMEIPRVREISKAKFLRKVLYEAKQESPEGGGGGEGGRGQT